MVVGRKVILKSKETGAVYTFNSMKNADRFLCRSESYVGNCYARNKTAVSFSGEEFEITVKGKAKHAKNNKQIYMNKLSQKCLTCARAYGFCEWSNNFKPVDGWEAIETIDADGALYSYNVISCPKYEEDAKTLAERKKQIERLKKEKYTNGRQTDAVQKSD